MKTKIWSITIFYFFVISQIQAQKKEYCIKKIDSTQNSYLITIQNKDFVGVVLSYKSQCNNKKTKLTENQKYSLQIIKHPVLNVIDISDLKVKSNGNPEVFISDIDVCKINNDCVVYYIDELCGLYLRY